MMKFARVGAALCAMIALTTPAFAQSSANSGLSASEIESRLTAQGYRVVFIEHDDGHFEVKAYTREGACVEMDVNRRTGEVMNSKSEDDCGSYERRRSR